MKKKLLVNNSEYSLPIFLPDATKAVVKTLDNVDLMASNIEGLVVNTFHLLSNPSMQVLKDAGGVKKFMNYKGLVASDSGGWQIFSLIHKNKKMGKITEEGVVFRIGNHRELLTPEKIIEYQFVIGSDIIICLDEFTPPNSTEQVIKNSVERTIRWAKRCKVRYLELLNEYEIKEENRPLLFAAVQGGESREYRKICAEGLAEIGFDGYGYGGYLVDSSTGILNYDLLGFLAESMPKEAYKFALGTGRPQDIVTMSGQGWDIFDCSLPTRDARHKRLYIINGNPKNGIDLAKPETFSYKYINKSIYLNDSAPIDLNCACYTCKNYSSSYINHLFKINSSVAERLSSIHNLFAYTKITHILRNDR